MLLFRVVCWQKSLDKKVLNFISKEIGDENVSEIPAVMGGEDFARYGRQDPKIPSLLFWLGGTSKENWKNYAQQVLILKQYEIADTSSQKPQVFYIQSC